VDMSELETSLAAYKKCMELDAKKDYPDALQKTKVGTEEYDKLAIALYNAKKFEDAGAFFEKSVEINQSYMGSIDTASIDNAALAYGKAKNYDKSIQMYNKLLDLKFKKEMSYALMLEILNLKGDDAGYKSTLTKARSEFPNNYDFIVSELNIFLKEGKSEEAIASINKAIEKEPKNYQLYLVLGQTYTKMAFPKDKDNKDLPKPANFDDLVKKATEAFTKAHELKPDDFKVNYSIGAFYNNLGAGKMKAAQDEKDMKKAAAMENEAVEIFKKAIPYLEKAHDIDKGDRDTMKALKQLYAKTGQADSPKYKEIEDLLKN